MKKNIDQIYLEKLCERLQSLLKVLNKRKPGSAYSKAENRALLDFKVIAPTGLLNFVRKLHNSTKLIPELPNARRDSGVFYVQMLHTLAKRQLYLFTNGEVKKLKAVQGELRANDVMEMNRKKYMPGKDEAFDKMIVKFLKTGVPFNDHIYKNIALLPEMYLSLLDYYVIHKEDLSGTRQWYDFLVISNYMLYGIKLELLELQNLKKR